MVNTESNKKRNKLQFLTVSLLNVITKCAVSLPLPYDSFIIICEILHKKHVHTYTLTPHQR